MHECSYLIARLHYGLPVIKVTLTQSASGAVTGAVHVPRGKYSCFARGVICVSGPLGEAKLVGHYDPVCARSEG